MRHWILRDIDQRIPILTSASPWSILVSSGRYHIISNASLVNNCIMRAYESISMHVHAHAALTLFYKRLFFSQSFFFYFTFFKTNFRYTIYHLFRSNKNPAVVPDLGPVCLEGGGGESPDDTNHLTQPHSMGSNTACWFIGKYGLSNAISEYPNDVSEFCSVS